MTVRQKLIEVALQKKRIEVAPFQKESDFGVTSVNYTTAEILGRAQEPS